MPAIEKHRFDVALEDLQTFLSVAEHESFSRAAEYLNLSQPSVSNRIRRLEEKLEVKLLLRTTRKVDLTAEGRRLQQQASETLLNLRTLLQEFHSTGQERERIVDVAATQTIAAMMLPPIIRKFQSVNPGSTVRLYDLREEEAMKAVLDGDCDLAVMTGDSLVSRLEYEELALDECVIVTSRNHPLIKPEGASLAEVLSYPILCPDAFYSMRRAVLAHAEPRGLSLKVAPEANGMKTTAAGLAMAAAGLGIYLCCRSWIPPEFLPTVGVTHFNDCKIMRSFGIVTAEGNDLGSAARRFRTLLRTLEANANGWQVAGPEAAAKPSKAVSASNSEHSAIGAAEPKRKHVNGSSGRML